MISYTYEELTSEEKRFLQYVKEEPFLTTNSVFPGIKRYGISSLTKGFLNKSLKIMITLFFILLSIIVLTKKQSVIIYTIYFVESIVMYCIMKSLFKLSKLNIGKESSLLQREVHLLNVHACKRVLLRNREPVEVRVLKETKRHIKVHFKETVPMKQRKFSFLKRSKVRIRKKDVLRIVQMNGYYYIFIRWNFSLIWHIRLTEQEFQKIDLEYTEPYIETYESNELTEIDYNHLIEESKGEAVQLKSYDRNNSLVIWNILLLLCLCLIIIYTIG